MGMEVVHYFMRLYRRWKYLRTPRPVFEPTVTPVERHWTDTDEKLERALYLANPHAVWLRPDRNEYKVPCWQIEGIWEAPQQMLYKPSYYTTASTGGHGLFALYNGILSGAQMKQQAKMDAAMAQNQYMNHISQLNGLSQQKPSMLGDLSYLGRMF